MITVKFVATFPSQEAMDSMKNLAPETNQMIQLVQFWSTQHNVTTTPPQVDMVNHKITYSYSVPDQTTLDSIIAHANDNGIDVYGLSQSVREHVQALGGTYERIDEHS